MNHSILSSIPKQDLPGFRTAVADVLNNQPDGASTTWTGSQPRRGGPIKADLTVKRSVDTQKASKCRLLDARISQDAESENWAFWFCQQPSGEWKASHN
ncbi:hypothetical protein [Bordetella petrii]|uniref:hypothetical protein n=1 Tax=Bordetella petrii TaxID=94624 RepID=UPI001E4599B1|nr:hypothetical protein [Bordetella petrii]MCD0502643.1 hypothetical protein [Bordetella petrii]